MLDSRRGRGHAESAAVLSAIVGAARGYAYLTNAYLAPRQLAIDVLAAAVARGARCACSYPV